MMSLSSGTSARALEFLSELAASRLNESARQWLDERIGAIRKGETRPLFLGFGLVPRKVGKSELSLSSHELARPSEIVPGWTLANHSLDHVVRLLLLLSFPAEPVETYVRTLDELFGAADVGELVTLYQSLPVLPHPESLVLRGAEGLRSNIPTVFAAIAHANPFPAAHFSDAQWNQMIVKAIFIGLPLHPIVRLDERSNPELARMLLDLVRERTKAHRLISPEVWRCIGPFLSLAEAEEFLVPQLAHDNWSLRTAAQLALRSAKTAEVRRLAQSAEAENVQHEMTWVEIANRFISDPPLASRSL